jgi:hypothetical protein
MIPYMPVFLVLIILGRYWVMRGPAGLTALENDRTPDVVEKALSRASMLLTVAVGIELYLTKGDFLTASEAYWLNILPLLWLALTIYRKDIPGDRTATSIGIWSLTPYAAYALSNKESPESTWLSLCLFGAAFLVGTLRDAKRPA